MRRWWWLIGAWGCGTKPGTEDTGPTCRDTPTVVAPDEPTDLGFTGQDVLALAEGGHDETFAWARDGSTTPLALDVTWDGGEVRFVRSEAVYPDGGTEPAIGVVCEDRLEVDVGVSFVTGDGAFDEQWDLALTAVSADTASLHAPLDPDALGGTYDMDRDLTATGWDERRLWADGTFDASGASGAVSGQVSGSDSTCADGEECTAWAQQVDVGSWGAE